MEHTADRKSSGSPLPSFTLQITKQDAEHFLEACSALRTRADAMGVKTSLLSQCGENLVSSDSKGAFHEELYRVAKDCQNKQIKLFLERNSKECLGDSYKMGLLLFCEASKDEKLKYFFSQLSTHADHQTLKESELMSMFEIILLSISCCTSTYRPKNVVVEGDPEGHRTSSDRLTKKAKREDDTVSTNPLTEYEETDLQGQSTSFDSSLATLRDEDEKSCNASSLKREIEEVTQYATDEVLKFAKSAESNADGVKATVFLKWWEKEGKDVAPWIELLCNSKWKSQANTKKQAVVDTAAVESPGSLLTEASDSRAILSFDFSDPAVPSPSIVNITEDNILALRNLVHRTGLIERSPEDLCQILIGLSSDKSTLSRECFEKNHHKLFTSVPLTHLSKSEKTFFKDNLLDFFSAFVTDKGGTADLRMLAIGFCLFCSGNKSTKLAIGFELMDSAQKGYLTEDELLQYLKAYLSMLVTTSQLVVPQSKSTVYSPKKPSRHLQAAVHRGAKWTLGHFVEDHANSAHAGRFTFDSFANWYSMAGYNVAPWLELLDLNKVLALVRDQSSPVRLPPLKSVPFTEPRPTVRDRVSSLRRHHSARRGANPPEVLFTFPLANRRSLIVLKDDAIYVRQVVEQLGLISVRPEHLWEALSGAVGNRQHRVARHEGPEYVDMKTFVQCVQEACPKVGRKRSYPTNGIPIFSASSAEVISNFFQCFDLNRTDSVAIDELMGGLSLLCGGKKSTKLSFAFSVFDTRPGAHARNKPRHFVHSLSGEDLFLFLRSVLIVTFSCCRQSLDMSDEMVGRCIADTANMICNDVMRYQWESKQLDRLDFDEFGQWYNEGGFERAPWLELLDLHKWVLVDNYETLEKKPSNVSQAPVDPPPSLRLPENNLPPPPPEDEVGDFFDENAIMPMDSMDEMDIMLMDHSDKSDIAPSPKANSAYSFGSPADHRKGNALKFHLVTNEKHGGYMLSMSHMRIGHFRSLILESGLHLLDPETMCNEILAKASRSKISKQSFDLAMESLSPNLKDEEKTRPIWDIITDIFSVFDPDNTGRANAVAVACGLTVLCQGKKSDKLEFAFGMLGRSKHGFLSKADVTVYLQSFLSVLLTISVSPVLHSDGIDDSLSTIKGKPCDSSPRAIVRAVKAGAHWAADLAFADIRPSGSSKNISMSFDDFASWYTVSGYSSIPWLELLDLHKWLLQSNKN